MSLVRYGFRPQARAIIEATRGMPVAHLQVCRRPIRDAYKWVVLQFANSRHKEQLAHDKLFHLFIIAGVETSAGLKTFIVEKNQYINVSAYQRQKEDEGIDLGGLLNAIAEEKRPDIETMLARTRAAQGNENFFRYNAFTNNCQMFAWHLLRANGFARAQWLVPLQRFIYQPVGHLVGHWTKKLAQGITDFANAADRVISGEGRQKKRVYYY